MKLIPHTSLSALFLWVVVWVSYFFIYPQIVQANALVPEVRALRESMSKLNARLIKEQFERDIRSIDTEIYNLEREIQSLQTRNIEVPGSMWDRLGRLKQDKAREERDLQQFMSTNGALLDRKEL